MTRLFLILVTCMLAMPTWADDDPTRFDFGGDSFRAGMSVSHDAAGTDDLFLAGDRVAGKADITGSAFLAGRKVTMEGAVVGDVYAAGEGVAIQGDVSGDASLLGRTVSVANVGGDLRVAASELRLTGIIGGNVIIAGEDVTFDAAVGGDVTLGAQRVDWGDAASIAGQLIVYEEELGSLEVPERVASDDRVERRVAEKQAEPQQPSWRPSIGDFVFEVIVVAVLAVLVAALMPTRLAGMQQRVLARPLHTFWLGFLALSAVIGACVLLAITIIGLPLVAALALLAFIGIIFGYVIATYVLGVRLLLAAGRPELDSIGNRAIAAGTGALAAAVIGLIPYLGWLFAIALAFAGIGAITVQLVRPVFFAETV